MATTQLTFNLNRPGRDKSTTPGGAAGIEIVGFPQVLYTRAFGDPDMLFVPLLEAAREAFHMTERLAKYGEARASAVTLSGMQLASALMRDSAFSLGAKGLPHENMYVVDLDAGTLLVKTRLFAVVSRRTSFFKVEIAGKISGGPFVVRAPEGAVIQQFEEEKARTTNFFATALAQDCLRAQMEHERFGRLEESSGEAAAEMRIVVNADGGKVPVLLRQKKEGGSWEIMDGRRQELISALSMEDQGHLSQVIRSVQDLFTHK